jgi:hypothetical protein
MPIPVVAIRWLQAIRVPTAAHRAALAAIQLKAGK